MAQPSLRSSARSSARSCPPLSPDRAELKAAFLKKHAAPQDIVSSFLAGDCSLRTYDRLRTDKPWFAPCVVLMNAPPPHERIAPFLEVAQLLTGLGLRVPYVYAFDIQHGFALLEDFGDITYRRALADNPAQKELLYKTALDTLDCTHTPSPTLQLPSYGIESLVGELESLFNWGAEVPLSLAAKEAAKELWRQVLAPIPRLNAAQPALVLRDYHVDNLMVLPAEGMAVCGLLDFQDALLGTQAYDVVSLLQDARVDVGEAFEAHMKNQWLAQKGSGFDREAFEVAYTLLGLQRAAKILGIFLRLARKNGRQEMLGHLPRVWRYIQRGLTSPLARPLVAWFDGLCPEGVPHA